MIQITQTRNACSLNTEDTMFYVEIMHPDYGWIPYTLNPDDTDETINNDNVRSLIGDEFAAYVPPTQEELDTEASNTVRFERDVRLAQEVDPIVSNPLRWGSLSDSTQLAFTVYRQNLLDVPEQEGFPHNVEWPTKPEV